MKTPEFNKLIKSTQNALNLPMDAMEKDHARRMQGLEGQMKKNVVKIQQATIRGNLQIEDHSETIEDELAKIRAELGLL